MFSTQQIVGEIETTQDIKTRTRDADDRDRVMIHSTIVEGALDERKKVNGSCSLTWSVAKRTRGGDMPEYGSSTYCLPNR